MNSTRLLHTRTSNINIDKYYKYSLRSEHLSVYRYVKHSLNVLYKHGMPTFNLDIGLSIETGKQIVNSK